MGAGASAIALSEETAEHLMHLDEDTMRELEELRSELVHLRTEDAKLRQDEGTYFGAPAVAIPAQTRRRARSRSPIWAIGADVLGQLDTLPSSAREEIEMLHQELEALRRRLT